MDENSTSARNRADADATTTPATSDQRRAVIDGVCRGQGWRTSRREQLAHSCDTCGAGPTFWCRRLGSAVVGYIHDRRGSLNQETRRETAPV